VADNGPAALEAVKLTKHFPVRGLRGRTGGVVHACEDVSLALYPKQVVAVVGESGSGKSTLARMLGRLITPTSGQIFLAGELQRTSPRGARSYRSEVQLVLQDPYASLNPPRASATRWNAR
jgi:peptide/nickel transport system ATP-binding protein